MALDKKGLEQTLEKIFDYMVQNNLVTQGMAAQKDTLIGNIAHELIENDIKLSADEVNKDANVQKKLMGLIVTKALGENKLNGQFIENLRDEDTRTKESPELNQKLGFAALLIKAIQNAVNEKIKNNDPTAVTKKELALSVDKTINKEIDTAINKQLDEKEKGLMIEEKDNYLAKLKDATMRNLTGGDDPAMTGEIQFPPLGPRISNALGWTNQWAVQPGSANKLQQDITFDTNMANDTGSECRAKNSYLEEGTSVTSCVMSLAENLIDIDIKESPQSPSPFKTTPGP